MMHLVGLIGSLFALVGWAVGDFLIQRSTRAVGAVETLFAITLTSTIILAPVLYDELFTYSPDAILALTFMSGLIFVYAILVFGAFRVGKLSVVESIIGFELPLSVLLGVMFLGDTLTAGQLGMFAVIVVGIILAVTKSRQDLRFHHHILEKGVILAFLATMFSAITNVSIGFMASTVDPLFVIWYTHMLLALMCFGILIARGQFVEFWRDLYDRPALFGGMSLADNVAWIGYAHAASVFPVSLTVMITESYIVLAALLGYFLNNERLEKHQLMGAAVALLGVVVLAATLK